MEIPKNVQTFCDFAWRRAKRLLHKDRFPGSTVFLLKGRNVSMVPAIFESDGEIDAFFTACSNAAKQEEAEAVVMVAEGWGLLARKGWTKKRMESEREKHGGVSKHPDREEILFMSCMLPSGYTFGKRAVMIRAGDSVALIDEVEMEGEKSKEQWPSMKPWAH